MNRKSEFVIKNDNNSISNNINQNYLTNLNSASKNASNYGSYQNFLLESSAKMIDYSEIDNNNFYINLGSVVARPNLQSNYFNFNSFGMNNELNFLAAAAAANSCS